MRQVALVECRTRLVGSTRSRDNEGGESATSRAASTGERIVVEVDNKFPERFRNSESWEETISWRVESPRGAICWVITAGDVTRDKKALVSAQDVVDMSEDLIGFPVPDPTLPPAFDNTMVVSKDPEDLAWQACCSKLSGKELEPNSLSPSDVPTICLPPWDEPPCSPLVADNNADTKT